MDMDAIAAEVNASIAAAQPKAATASVDAENLENAKTTEPVDEVAEGEQPEPQGEGDPDKPWPKKFENAFGKEKQKNNKLKLSVQLKDAELSKLRSDYEALRSRQLPPAPKEADFEGKPYEQLLEAKAEHAADKRLNERETKQAEDKVIAAENAWKAEREQIANESDLEASSAIPDYRATIEKNLVRRGDPTVNNGAGFIPLSDTARALLLDADNPALALYSILKDGDLNELNNLSVTRAASLVARHEIKGNAAAKIKRVSTAPEPMSPAKGNGAGGRPIEQLSPKELLRMARNG